MAGFPRRYVVFDTETTPEPTARKRWEYQHRLRLGVAKVYDPLATGTDTPLYHGFEDAAGFRTLLMGMMRADIPIFLFAHNIGYDLRMVRFFDMLTAGDLSLVPNANVNQAHRYKDPLFISDGFPTMMRFFRPDGQRIMVIDSLNWMPVKLAEIGEWVGMPKAEMPKPEAPDGDWWDYCRRDVDVLDRALRRLWGWLQSIGLRDWSPTPAGQAMLTYKMRCERKRIVRPDDPAEHALARHAYYGGRIEPYHLGLYEHQTYELDVISLYPHVMRDNPYPCRLIDRGDHAGEPAASWPHDPADCVAEVWLKSPDAPYPIRGVDGTWWVSGKVRTILPGPELERAFAAGHVVRVGRWARYERINLFQQYIDMFWTLRARAIKRGDKQVERTCKALMNSLHGKFGQRDGAWEYAGRQYNSGDYMCGRRTTPGEPGGVDVRVLDGHYFERGTDREHPGGFVPIAAWCTSYARLYMDDMIAIAGPDHVRYLAIDAVIVDGQGLGNLQMRGVVNTGQRGHFKVKDTYTWIDIQGVNSVDHSSGSKHAGIKSGSSAVADGIWSVEEWESLTEGIYSGNHTSVFTRRTLKSSARDYGKRYVDAGGITRPYLADNWSESPETSARQRVGGRLCGRLD